MRKITLIIIHCSAVKPDQTSSAREIDQWHKARGWKGIGYHYVIRRDGSVEPGRPEETVGAHCQGHNSHSIGVCYEGGLDAHGAPADTRTEAQKQSMLTLLRQLKDRYEPKGSPDNPGGASGKIIIVGHNVFNPQKACPCFDAAKEYLHL